MDGSAECAAVLSRRRAILRIFLPPASCKPNSSAQTGTPKAAAAKAIACKYAAFRSQVPAFFYNSGERPLQIGEWRRRRSFSRIEDNVQVKLLPLIPMQAECRPQSPLDPVAYHRASDRARHRKAQPHTCSILFARHRKRGEQRTGEALSFFIDSSEFGGSQDASGSRKRCAGTGFNGNSEQLFRRLRTICAGPAHAAARARPVRPLFPCATGIHAFWRACDCCAVVYVWAFDFLHRAHPQPRGALLFRIFRQPQYSRPVTSPAYPYKSCPSPGIRPTGTRASRRE